MRRLAGVIPDQSTKSSCLISSDEAGTLKVVLITLSGYWYRATATVQRRRHVHPSSINQPRGKRPKPVQFSCGRSPHRHHLLARYFSSCAAAAAASDAFSFIAAIFARSACSRTTSSRAKFDARWYRSGSSTAIRKLTWRETHNGHRYAVYSTHAVSIMMPARLQAGLRRERRREDRRAPRGGHS
jgi:hypothetical protein